jgi:hypothetical protein
MRRTENLTRRRILMAIAGVTVLGSSAHSFLPLLLRFLFTAGVRTGASAAVRATTRSVVTRTVVSNGVRRSVQMVATKEIGLSIAGVAFISASAAAAIEEHDCKAVCVLGSDHDAVVVAETPVREAMNITINLVNVLTRSVDSERGVYVAPGEFRYSIDFPNALQNGVKRLEAFSPTNLAHRVSSANFYLAHPSELFR